MSDKIKVFVSSIQNKQVEDLIEEREAAIRAIKSVPYAEAWAFEHEPAMPQPPEEVFLEGIANSDIFVLIIGEQLTPAVKKEYDYAADLQRRTLIFPKNGVPKSSDVVNLLEKASSDCKYDSFKNSEDLEQKCARALEDIIVKAVKHPTPAIPSKLFTLTQELEKLIKEHKPIRIHPLYPQNRMNDIFYIETTNSQFIKLQKSSNGQAVSIPLSKIGNIMHSSEESVLELNGRLQWVDPSLRWKYLPGAPDTQDPHGVTRKVSLEYPDHSGLSELLTGKGYDLRWSSEVKLPSWLESDWEIVYDEDGYYLVHAEYGHMGETRLIYIKKSKA